METKYYVIIKVLDENGNWYNNAYIENDFDAFHVARFYRNVLGYSVQVWKHDKDITAMLDTGKTVVVKKFD
mgnify:FL=1|jgi:hypothetical protein